MKTKHIKINENVYDFTGPIYDGDNVGSACMISSDAQGENAFAEGYNTTASGDNSHSEGVDTIASGDNSHAEGNNTSATSDNCHSEGVSTTASGVGSHTEGNGTIASGAASHAEGTSSTASGTSSHAEGGSCIASADNAHAEGYRCTAKHSGAHVEGGYQESGAAYQHVQGRYAISLGSTYIDIVGWGSGASSRSNVAVLDTSGNLVIKGKLYQDATNDECTTGLPILAKIYRHTLAISNGNDTVTVSFVTNSETAFDLLTFENYYKTKINTPLLANGSFYDTAYPNVSGSAFKLTADTFPSAQNGTITITGIDMTSSPMKAVYATWYGTINNVTVTDTVTEA